MKYIKYLIVVFVLCNATSFAQEEVDTAIFKRWFFSMKRIARLTAAEKDYNAIEYYKYYINHKPTWPNYIFAKPKVTFELADAYRKANDYKNAEHYYKQAYDLKPKKLIKALYYQGVMQKMLGDITAAKETLEKYKKNSKFDKSPGAAARKKLVKIQILGIDSMNLFTNKGSSLEITHLDTSINKAYMDVSPILYDKNSFIYVSLKADTLLYFKRTSQFTNFQYAPFKTDTALELRKPLPDPLPPLTRFYMGNRHKDVWTDSMPFNDSFNVDSSNVENGCFNAEKDKFFFTLKEYDPQIQKKLHRIYVSKKVDGAWQIPVKLPDVINIPGFNATMPAIGYESSTEAEVLYFCSDKKGSKGGYDIWYSNYDEAKKKYSNPKNAGSKINTVGDELTPFYDNVNKILYFSSDGWPGMGGLDIFKSFGETAKLSAPSNLKAPINTHVDDIYYIVNEKGDEGFLSSNRKPSIALKHEYCCFDLYQHKKTLHLAIDLFVYKSDKKHEIKEVFDHNKNEYVTRTTMDSTVVKLFVLNDSNSGGEIFVREIPVDKNGQLLLTLEEDEKYRFVVSRPGYFSNAFEFSTKKMIKSDTIFQPVGLHNISKQPIVIPNIYYEYDKANLTPESTITIDTTIYKILVENPDIIAEIGSHTDARGSDEYNIVLSQKRAESVVNYLISKKIDPKRLRAKGYGETRFIAPNDKPDGSDDPEGRQKNRRTEFRIIGQIDKYSEIIYTE